MADVIFSGTDSKQPVGNGGSIPHVYRLRKRSRDRIQRSQDYPPGFPGRRSEYLLNKDCCRLRDIQMLFMDTGIGRTAYSIMEQGKIDLILSSDQKIAGRFLKKPQESPSTRLRRKRLSANLSTLTRTWFAWPTS